MDEIDQPPADPGVGQTGAMGRRHREALDQLRREAVRSRLAQGRVLDRFGIAHVTEEEIDTALDEGDLTAAPLTPDNALPAR